MSEEHFLGDKKKEEKEEEEVSSLFLAVQNGSQELVQLLLNEEGANVDSPNQVSFFCFVFFFSSPFSFSFFLVFNFLFLFLFFLCV